MVIGTLMCYINPLKKIVQLAQMLISSNDIYLEYCLEILRSFELDTHNCNWLQIHLVAKQGCLIEK